MDGERLDALRSMGEVQQYRAGSNLFTPGDDAQSLYVVLTGLIRVYALSYEGREITYWYCRRGDFVGMTEIWAGGPRRIYAAARIESEVIALPMAQIDAVFAARPDVGVAMLRHFALRLRNARETVLAVVAGSARARIARVLLLLPHVENEAGGRSLAESYTQLELANMTGLSRQTASELLAVLRREGLIAMNGRRIVLRDVEAITAIASASL